MPAPVSLNAISAAAEPNPPNPKNVQEAARQFESLLIAQLLRSSHSGQEGFGDEEEDSQTSTVLDMASQQFAQVLANNGGLGLAHMVAQGLKQNQAPGPPEAQPGH